jgi:nucleoside-diphosphate-sugar epimerase
MARRAPRGGLAARFRFVPCDYVKGEYPPDAFAGQDAMVFATGIDWREAPLEDPLQFFRRVNVEAPRAIFSAAVSKDVRRCVFVTSYYHAIRPDLHDQPYIRSRVESEHAVLAACAGRAQLSIVQPSWVMGPITGMEAIGFGSLLTRMVDGPWPVIAPPGGTNWISARSLGIAIATALERGEDARKYLVGDENWSWLDVFRGFARLSSTGKPVHLLPRSVVMGTGWTRLALRALRGRRTGWDERNWSRLLMEPLFFDAGDSQRALGYPTGDIQRAIEETYRTCRASVHEGNEALA